MPKYRFKWMIAVSGEWTILNTVPVCITLTIIMNYIAQQKLITVGKYWLTENYFRMTSYVVSYFIISSDLSA